jgi:hypothetical protein
VEALAHEYPKLSAVAHVDGTSFADRLEKELRAIERSKQPVPLLNGPPPAIPASELKKPFSNYRNNYRRY